MMNRQAAIALLEWYQDMGVTTPMQDTPNNRFAQDLDTPEISQPNDVAAEKKANPAPTLASDALIEQAEGAAANCQSLDDLKQAVLAFDGHPLKKLATNLVFESGNRAAKIMIVGDAPESDEDRSGQAFAGMNGQMLDKIYAAIGLSRSDESAENALYMTHCLHWRPPGNRSPSDEEIALSLPFVKRQIELVNPSILILMGGLAAKTLLAKQGSISRLRGQFYDYGDSKIPALASYAPGFLISNPLQKKKVWQDMLSLKDKIDALR